MELKEIKRRAAAFTLMHSIAHLLDGDLEPSDTDAVDNILSPLLLDLHYNDKGGKGNTEFWFQYRVWRERRPKGAADWSKRVRREIEG